MKALRIVHMFCECQEWTCTRAPLSPWLWPHPPLAQLAFSFSDELTTVWPEEQSAWPENSKLSQMVCFLSGRENMCSSFARKKQLGTSCFHYTWLPPPISPNVCGTGKWAWSQMIKPIWFMNLSGGKKQETKGLAAGAMTSSLWHSVLVLEKCSLHRLEDFKTPETEAIWLLGQLLSAMKLKVLSSRVSKGWNVGM